MEYEWDTRIAAENFLKHGIAFEEAVYAPGDPLSVEEPDDRFDYGEERHLAIAMGMKSLLAIVYTEHGGSARIISAREATRNEQRNYYRQNAN